jgi:hypothetical protein
MLPYAYIIRLGVLQLSVKQKPLSATGDCKAIIGASRLWLAERGASTTSGGWAKLVPYCVQCRLIKGPMLTCAHTP